MSNVAVCDIFGFTALSTNFNHIVMSYYFFNNVFLGKSLVRKSSNRSCAGLRSARLRAFAPLFFSRVSDKSFISVLRALVNSIKSLSLGLSFSLVFFLF